MKKNLIIAVLTTLFCIPSFAQYADSVCVMQYVSDSFTKHGIPEVFITLADTNGIMIDTLWTQKSYDDISPDGRRACWSKYLFRKPQTILVKAEHPDYVTAVQRLDFSKPGRRMDFEFPEMFMKRKMKETTLQEVTVKATRVQIAYKGDTIVVDAQAFKIPEGSMLDALVASVPGAELHDDGTIYMNGRKVDYLTLNGKDFFKGNNRIMLDNLPYYTVDKLQFYNKQSERSQLMGKDVERPDYVMNVKLRQEYSIGYLGNVEAGAGTHDRWLGRGFALRFTDNSRLSLFGNANNINESRHPGEDGKWGQAGSPEGDRDSYNVGGDLMIDDKHGRYKEEFNTSLLWSKARDEQRTTSQQFIESGDTYGYSNDVSKKRNFALSAKNKLSLRRLGLVSSSRVEYSHHNDNALTRSAQFSQKPHEDLMRTLDSIFSTNRSSEMQSIMVNNVRDAARDRGNTWEAEQKMDYHKSLPWGDDLMLNASGVFN